MQSTYYEHQYGQGLVLASDYRLGTGSEKDYILGTGLSFGYVEQSGFLPSDAKMDPCSCWRVG